MGEAMMLKGFAVIILGGLGDIRGALVAGLLIGLLEALTAGYVSSAEGSGRLSAAGADLWVPPRRIVRPRPGRSAPEMPAWLDDFSGPTRASSSRSASTACWR